jgi:hypothetical protein
VGDEIGKLDYATAFEVHERGSLLVFAIYDAFITMALSRGMGMAGDASGDQYDAYAPFDPQVGANLRNLLDGNPIAFKENDTVEKREAENLAAIISPTFGPLWMDRLSMTTISPGRGSGTSTFST